ncbi:hypothetical protein MKX07_008554 [Trichoderma sp. CBMAI-0711]|nr:hypothetical protein MKX07_008554 [Trichoderma sp. CBMAI-0711]
MSTERIKVPPNGLEIKSVLSPITPTIPTTPFTSSFTPLVTVVGFHHARGPEVESWFGVEEGVDPAAKYGWNLLPFMALSDGAHASEEDFSYFTLLRPETDDGPATSLFGISCTRQLDSSQLINRPADVTRSTVQKAVVVIADSPQFFGMLRQRLSIVTQAWFAQREFTDVDILRGFQESLADEKARGILQEEAQRDQYLGMSLRELIHEFKWQALVLLKCCLLQPKMLFFGSRCDRLCMVQFSLISLIPGLIRNLQDCADPELNTYEKKLAQPTSLQSSNRNSLLTFMGLPLQIFGKGSIFGPYTPLQQLDLLADVGTKSYIVGSTNSLLLQQKDRYSDIIINLDDDTISITSPSLRTALSLTAADRRWIDYLTQEVNNTWDESNPSTPKTMQYAGSEEYIRAQFESYIIGLISSVKFHNYLVKNAATGRNTAESDPAVDFGLDWVEAWQRTENYRMWDAHTDTNLFAVSEPRHPCAGGLSIEDVQRRIAEQVKELHLDERLAQGRDILGRNFAAGKEKASTMLNRLYNDMEQMREAQRRRAEENAKLNEANGGGGSKRNSMASGTSVDAASKPQQETVSSRASAYMASWASWAGEKRRNGGWGGGWGKKKTASSTTTSGGAAADGTASMPTSPIEKDYQFVSMLASAAGRGTNSTEAYRPMTQGSFSESILSGADSSRPGTGSSAAEAPLTQYPREFDHDDDDRHEDDGFREETLVGNGGTKKAD